MPDDIRVHLRVDGIVQGVGFRPFVHRVATDLGIAGLVGNDPEGVFVEAEGPPDLLADFRAALRTEAPALAVVDAVRVVEHQALTSEPGFRIVGSRVGANRSAAVSPDAVPCRRCLAEVDDPSDRRYGHPLANCTDCGPRFSIVREVPYDRARTTMASFAPCRRCQAEYDDPHDRRFHAQPVCCPDCGPRVQLSGTSLQDRAAIEKAAELLRDGAIVAVKGVGGFHLAALARDDEAVSRLRAAKHREDKPFAVLVADLTAAGDVVEVDADAAELLSSTAGPIVLLPRQRDAPVAESVAPGHRRLGVMLPPSPLHHLLVQAVGEPVVLTSGNLSTEPIVYGDEEAAGRLQPMSDAILGHDRPIHVRVEDSVATVVDGRPMVLRRSRGYTPAAIVLPLALQRPALAVGAHLKNTLAVGRGRSAYASPHIGDLDTFDARTAFERMAWHLGRLFDVEPEVVVHDLHPGYASTAFAEELALDAVPVQHHHAHVASCLVDNGHLGPVIGVAFDGTGYGHDRTAWGGEVLAGDLAQVDRIGHLGPTRLPGGEAAIRFPWRMAVSHLRAAGCVAPADLQSRQDPTTWDRVRALTGNADLSPVTTSVGRLFDAVGAMVVGRDEATYEGQAAVELEQTSSPGDHGSWEPVLHLEPGDQPFVMDPGPLVRGVVDDLREGRPAPQIGARFHASLVRLVAAGCEVARERTGLDVVALTGGVFQNTRLTSGLRHRLATSGFTVLVHRRIPPNDGGISIGQLAVLAAQDASGT